MDGGCEGARATVLGAALAFVAGFSGRASDFVAGLAVEETMIAGFAVDGCGACQAVGGVSLELECLHGHD